MESAPISWYCVRVDHVVRPATTRPVLTMHDRSWAFCRADARGEDHFWAPARGLSVREFYPDAADDVADALRARSLLECVEMLRDDIRDAVQCTSCAVDIARTPDPLRIEFDAEARRGASTAVDVADAEGVLARVTVFDAARAEFSAAEVTLLRSTVAPYVSALRAWVGTTAGRN